MGPFYIYLWTNLLNGKRYVGKGKGARAHMHLRKHSKSLLSAAMRKYGPENFRLEYLAAGLDEDTAFDLERAAIVAYDTKGDGGYNITLGGEGRAGMKPQGAHAEKLAAYRNGRVPSEEMRAKISRSLQGKKHSEERRANQRAAALHGLLRQTAIGPP